MAKKKADPCGIDLFRPEGGEGLEAFAFQALAFHLAGATHGFRTFTRFALRRLFVMPTEFHFTENAFALHFFLERFESLIDIVVTD